MKADVLPRYLPGMYKPDAKMLFKALEFKNSPKAEPFAPGITLRIPDWPEVNDPEPGAKMLNPSRMPLSPDPDEAGDARLCRAPGSADSSCDNVLCPVPASVAAASVTAATWAVGPVALAICAGWVNEVNWLLITDENAFN
jgi:hypothetical protein